MKSFKQFTEAQTTHDTKGFIFSNFDSPALILSPTMIDRVFGQTRVDAWHVTDFSGLKGLKRIEGKKASISVLTEIEPGRVKIFTKGVETGGGYCINLEGSLLVSSTMDVYSSRLEAGRRGVAIGSDDYPSLNKDLIKMQDKMWSKYADQNEKKNDSNFKKLGRTLSQKEKGQFVKEWIDNCESILKKNKKAQDELRTVGRATWSTYNESVVNQIKIKRIYVINDDKFEKFGRNYQLAKGMFTDVLEVTSERMGEIITK